MNQWLAIGGTVAVAMWLIVLGLSFAPFLYRALLRGGQAWRRNPLGGTLAVAVVGLWVVYGGTKPSPKPEPEPKPDPEPVSHVITYDLGGGTNHEENPNSYMEGNLQIELLPATRNGYLFNGWSPNDGIVPASSTSNFLFTAKWLESPMGTDFAFIAGGLARWTIDSDQKAFLSDLATKKGVSWLEASFNSSSDVGRICFNFVIEGGNSMSFWVDGKNKFSFSGGETNCSVVVKGQGKHVFKWSSSLAVGARVILSGVEWKMGEENSGETPSDNPEDKPGETPSDGPEDKPSKPVDDPGIEDGPVADDTMSMLYEKVSGRHDAATAQTFDGYLFRDDGTPAGTIQIKTAVGKVNRKTQVKASKLTVSIAEMGQKKVSAKGELNVETGVVLWSKPTAKPLALVLGTDGLSGTYGSYRIDGARNLFVSKVATDKSAVAVVLAKLQGVTTIAYPAAAGWNGLSVSISAKGKAKVSGVLADGTKFSANSQLIVGENLCCVPVVCLKKTVALSFCLWLPKNGQPGEVVGLGEDVLLARLGVLTGTTIDCAVSDIKSGYHLGEKGYEGWKPRVTAKTGLFKGSFKCYETVNGREKKVTVTVNGVVVDGVGYGAAMVKKVGATFILIK